MEIAMGMTAVIVLMFIVFLAGLLGNWILRHILHIRSESANDSCVTLKTDYGQSELMPKRENFQILDKIGCCLASNDEKDMKVYTATPLQDIDPKDFA
jgi:hypothetical protein